MPIHDWTRVEAGIFHHFHHDWISMLSRGLNAGRLPEGFYALAEQIAGGLGPDVLTLEAPRSPSSSPANGHEVEGDGGVAIASAPPRVRHVAESDLTTRRPERRKQSRIAIRHASNHRVVAVVEIVSPGNKSSQSALQSFVSKAVELIDAGIHLLVIDLFPPSPRDPHGMHAAIWAEIEPEHPFVPAADSPLTLVSYSAGPVRRAYIEPTAIGRSLTAMPLFLGPDRYVEAPLEESYLAAFDGVPRIWRESLT